MTETTEIIFWISGVMLAYIYVGYPMVVKLWSSRAASRANPEPSQSAMPAVSVLVVAYNEAQRIAAKVDNLLALDYPSELMEIVIACDGCTDDTEAVARRTGGEKISVIPFSRQRGKAAVLSELVPAMRGDIVVLMDVRQRIEQHTLQALLAPFADPGTGAVGGELMLADSQHNSATGKGVGFYWRYEKFIRQHESRVDSSVGVSGAIYALRRELFQAIPPSTILDDVLIPMQVVRQGYRVVFEPNARAFDKASDSAREEFRRKVRTIAGNFQLLLHHPWLMNPRSNRLWLQTISHKFLRLTGPLCLVTAFVCNLMLAGQPAYGILLVMQIVFYIAAIAGCMSSKTPSGVVSVPYAFCLLNWATVLGFIHFLAGRQQATWKK